MRSLTTAALFFLLYAPAALAFTVRSPFVWDTPKPAPAKRTPLTRRQQYERYQQQQIKSFRKRDGRVPAVVASELDLIERKRERARAYTRDFALDTAPPAHLYARDDPSVTLPNVNASIGPINATVGSVNVTIGNVDVGIGNINISDIHIGNISVIVSVAFQQQAATTSNSAIGASQTAASGSTSGAASATTTGATTATAPATTAAGSSSSTAAAGATARRRAFPHDLADREADALAPRQAATSTSAGEIVTITPSATATIGGGGISLPAPTVSGGSVSVGTGSIGVAVGNITVSVGNINVRLGSVTIRDITIGNVLVVVKLGQQGQ